MGWRKEEGSVSQACWSPTEAEQIIPIEAEAVPDWVFAAAHVPLALRPVNPTTLRPTGTDDATDEAAVLAHVRDANGTDIVPILGESGAGKSHLVRWLRNELRRKPPKATRVVFIPKHRTSLYGVVELVLNAFADEPFAAGFRERLRTAQDTGATDKELRAQIRDEIARGIEHHPERTDVVESLKAHRDWLSRELPKLLRDPLFAPRYLAEDAAIARLVEEKRYGRAGDNAVDAAFRFGPSDVSVSLDDVSRAAKDAQELARQLAAEKAPKDGNVGELLALSVRLINDQLPAALKRVFGIGGDDLKELFLEIRQTLHGQERVVLLVEDFSMFQGLQGGLIDAMTLHSTPETPLCDLVTVLAVTTGYYRDNITETMKTRSQTAFEVSKTQDATLDRFVAVYLSAIRAGEGELREAYNEGRPHKSVCDECPVRERCHSDNAFGAVDGQGLFPFNHTALVRAMGTAHGPTFNARAVLRRVLHPVLVADHAAIEAGDFPTPAFRERFSSGAYALSVADEGELSRSSHGERRITLAELYADPPGSADLHPAIHDAFALPPRGVIEKRRGKDDEEEEKPKRQRNTPKLVSAVEDWRRTGALSQTQRNAIRKLVHRAVVQRLPFDDGALRAREWARNKREDLPDPFFVEADVVIDENRLTAAGAVSLDIRGDDLQAVEAVQALAWLDGTESLRDIPQVGQHLTRLDVVLERWAAEVERQLGAWSDVDDELVVIANALEVATAFLGLLPASARRSLEDRIAAMVTEGVASDRSPDLAAETEKVADVARLLRRMLLRRASFSQGAGAPSILDTPKVRAALGRRVNPEKVSLTDDVRKAARLAASLGERLEDHRRQMSAKLPDIQALGGEEPSVLGKDLIAVLERSATGGGLAQRVQTAADAIQTSDVATVSRVARSLDRWAALDTIERAALIGGTWHGAASRLSTFIDAAIEAVQRATPTASGEGSTEDPAFVGQQWRATLDDLHGFLRKRVG